MLELEVQEVETLDAPGWVEWVVGIGSRDRARCGRGRDHLNDTAGPATEARGQRPRADGGAGTAVTGQIAVPRSTD
jgi:hypothetical protein